MRLKNDLQSGLTTESRRLRAAAGITVTLKGQQLGMAVCQ